MRRLCSAEWWICCVWIVSWELCGIILVYFKFVSCCRRNLQKLWQTSICKCSLWVKDYNAGPPGCEVQVFTAVGDRLSLVRLGSWKSQCGAKQHKMEQQNQLSSLAAGSVSWSLC